MDELSQEQLEALAAGLELERRRLRGDIRDELLRSDDERYGELAGQVHDTGDESVADLLSDVNATVLSHLIQELRDVEGAQQRLAVGDYGHCIDCGEAIGYARLHAQPTALRCIQDQERHEHEKGLDDLHPSM